MSTFDIPETEPSRVRAGDLWEWKRDFSDFPASAGWSLTYSFRHRTNTGFAISSTADGDKFLASFSATSSAAIAAGTYQGMGRVANGSDVFTVWEGELEVEANLAGATTALDVRTDSRKILDGLIALRVNWASSGNAGGVRAYTIEDRSLTYAFNSLKELDDAIIFWEIRVKNEEAAERLRSGKGGGKRLLARL